MDVAAPLPHVDRSTLELHGWLRELEGASQRVAAEPTDRGIGPTAADRFVAERRERVRARLDEAYSTLSMGISELPNHRREASARMHAALVRPFFLHSPFCRRMLDQPWPAAPDFALVEMLHAGADHAPSPLGRLLGLYALDVGPHVVERGRVAFVAEALARLPAAGGLRVLAWGCGPEVPLRRWVAAGGEAEIVLVDPRPEALTWATRRIEVTRPPGNRTRITAVRPEPDEAPAALLARLAARRPFDVVSAPDALDALDDEASTALLAALAGALRPGGALLLTATHAPNPWRAFQELVLGRAPACRSVLDVERLVRRAERFARTRVTAHPSGAGLYATLFRA